MAFLIYNNMILCYCKIAHKKTFDFSIVFLCFVSNLLLIHPKIYHSNSKIVARSCSNVL